MNKNIKLLITIISFILTFIFFIERQYGLCLFFITILLISIILYFKNENIILSFIYLRKNNIEKASKWINKIKNPDKEIYKSQIGYYNYIKGITLYEKDINKCEKFMRKALESGLFFKHDKSMANLAITNACIARGDKKNADKYLKEAKKLDDKGIFSEQIKLINNQLKKFNTNRSNIQNPNFRYSKRKVR